eukprot:3891997-Amphidinium_carterae.1
MGVATKSCYKGCKSSEALQNCAGLGLEICAKYEIIEVGLAGVVSLSSIALIDGTASPILRIQVLGLYYFSSSSQNRRP